jgi:hypothetical protein
MRPGLFLAAALALGTATVPAAPAAPAAPVAPVARPALVDRLHAEGVAWFRAARFPAAYGRFVALAEVGHEASARYALWMCLHGPELFGSDWDCSPDQVQDWSRFAGVPAPPLPARSYRRPDAARSPEGTRPAARRTDPVR